MAPTFQLWFHGYTLQITTIVRDSTPFSCREWFPVNVFFGISTSDGLHDANLWSRTEIGRFCEDGRLSPYALVGDAAYPCHPWMISPFKGHQDGLTREEYHWNFVQNSTWMCVERAFGILKGRWRILLKRIDVHLKKILNLWAHVWYFITFALYLGIIFEKQSGCKKRLTRCRALYAPVLK